LTTRKIRIVDEETAFGPLAGIKVVELAGIAPAPFGATVLADLGAEVVRVDRCDTAADDTTGPSADPPPDPLGRGRRSIAVDLRDPAGAELVLRLTDQADVLVEGFRPGVCERLGIGPEVTLARNPRLVYARLTGWGQAGPLASTAGHDITYLALSGGLQPLGPFDGPPLPPVNFVADFGGGGMLLAVGVLAALLERQRSGRGQVIDAAMLDGAGLLSAFLHGAHASGLWSGRRGEFVLDGSAPFYTTYTCADGGFVAVGPLEPKFYAELLRGLGLDEADLPDQYDRAGWPVLRETFAAAFASRPRDEWAKLFAMTDACVAPVLSPWEAAEHPHLAAREAFVDVAGVRQPAPAPRFSRTPGAVRSAAPRPGQHTSAILRDVGLTDDEIERLRGDGVIR
jgi:alpha-methylacyl-CoA racemase